MKLILALSLAVATFADPAAVIRDDNEATKAKGTTVAHELAAGTAESEGEGNVSSQLRGAKLFPFVQEELACKNNGQRCRWPTPNCCSGNGCSYQGSNSKCEAGKKSLMQAW